MIKNYLIASLILLFLSNCSLYREPESSLTTYQSKQEYIEAVSEISHWEIQGKIAFLEGRKRQSANIFWERDELSHTQSINLTTYLGINVLTLASTQNYHVLNVDGQEHTTTDINNLIQKMTGYQLPTRALSAWLKGLSYDKNDIIEVNPTSFLPQHMTSYYKGKKWDISYDKYRVFSGYTLPSHLVIKQNNFTLKIMIHQWKIL